MYYYTMYKYPYIYLLYLVALQSVFRQSELGTFMALTVADKEKQLLELSRIVTGIRLFNKNCGKGGEGIDDCKHLYLHVLVYIVSHHLLIKLFCLYIIHVHIHVYMYIFLLGGSDVNVYM